MREFVSDLMFMCSGSNTSSRTFYIIVTAVLALLVLGIPAMTILLIVTAVKGGSIVLPLVLLIFAIIVFIGIIIWLKKS